jgi:hypothetical protein
MLNTCIYTVVDLTMGWVGLEAPYRYEPLEPLLTPPKFSNMNWRSWKSIWSSRG